MPHVVMIVGYNTYVLPDNIKIDHVKELTNAVEVFKHGYGSDGSYGYSGKGENIRFEIISDNNLSMVEMGKLNDEHALIADEIIEKLEMRKKAQKQKMSIKFTDEEIKVGSNAKSWPEIGDPDFDPGKFANDIVSELFEGV